MTKQHNRFRFLHSGELDVEIYAGYDVYDVQLIVQDSHCEEVIQTYQTTSEVRALKIKSELENRYNGDSA